MTPPDIARGDLWDWTLGAASGRFNLRPYNDTVRSGSRPSFYLSSGRITDWRYENGTIPPTSGFTATMKKYYTW